MGRFRSVSMLDNSLRCIQHPLSVSGIALLMLNDHVFKAIWPSLLTGKLSDLGGLLFFPFILAAALSLLAQKAKLSTHWIGGMAFGATGLGFLALKTLPAVNSLAGEIASVGLGRPTTYSLDWTDCIALIALAPAYQLWRNGENLRGRSRRMGLVALATGALASIATSPVLPPETIIAFSQRENLVYAASEGGMIFVSSDLGRTWQRCDRQACQLVPEDFPAKAFPIKACDTRHPKVCFRIQGEPEIEISRDAGETWSTEWEIPVGRRPFAARQGAAAPRDLLLVSDASSNQFLLVAMEDEGVMRRELPDGTWQRIDIQSVPPRHLFAQNLAEAADSVKPEAAVGLAAALGSVVLGGLILGLDAGDRSIRRWTLITWMLVTLIGGSAALALAWFVDLLFMEAVDFMLGLSISYQTWVVLTAGLGYGLTFLVFRWRLRNIARVAGLASERRREFVRAGLFVAAAIALATPLSWILWALGTIADYNTALIIAVVLDSLILVAGYYPLVHGRWISRAPVQPPES